MEGKLRKDSTVFSRPVTENPTQKEWAASKADSDIGALDLTLDIGNAAFDANFTELFGGVAGGLIADRAKVGDVDYRFTLEDADALRQHDLALNAEPLVELYTSTLPVTIKELNKMIAELESPAATLSEEAFILNPKRKDKLKMAQVTSMANNGGVPNGLPLKATLSRDSTTKARRLILGGYSPDELLKYLNVGEETMILEDFRHMLSWPENCRWATFEEQVRNTGQNLGTAPTTRHSIERIDNSKGYTMGVYICNRWRESFEAFLSDMIGIKCRCLNPHDTAYKYYGALARERAYRHGKSRTYEYRVCSEVSLVKSGRVKSCGCLSRQHTTKPKKIWRWKCDCGADFHVAVGQKYNRLTAVNFAGTTTRMKTLPPGLRPWDGKESQGSRYHYRRPRSSSFS
ncbi:hypothetical protein SPFM1_00021 [Salmonella phage SPFM1]|nr:hypothetical protein SPFM1_00021 [Salmonella phage SPFM1]